MMTLTLTFDGILKSIAHFGSVAVCCCVAAIFAFMFEIENRATVIAKERQANQRVNKVKKP